MNELVEEPVSQVQSSDKKLLGMAGPSDYELQDMSIRKDDISV